jgi:tetratricopeptide (TPR) repeat protein
MKPIIFKAVFLATLVFLAVSNIVGQRVIKGTVYKGGKPAAGINVEVHKGKSMMTSFDGKYEVGADVSSKWIKFTDIATEESKKLDLTPTSGDNIDFYFDNVKPAAVEKTSSDVNLKTLAELQKEKNMDALSEYSLFQSFSDNKDYKSAYPHWEKLMKSYPKISPNIYINGVTILEDQLENAKTFPEKENTIHRIRDVYDQRIKYFGREGYVHGRKGKFWLDFYVHNNDSIDEAKRKEVLKKGYEWLSQSVKLQSAETEPPVLVLLMNSSSALFKLGELTKENVIKNYETCSTLISDMLAKAKPEDKEILTRSAEYIDKIFGDSGAADCDALISIYAPQFDQNSGNVDWIRKMLRKLNSANCDESELYSKATEKLFQLDPSPESAYNMARRFLKKNDIVKAKEYYKQAMSQETDQERLKVYYYEYGLLIFVKDNALQEARTYANKALAIDPTYCKALMLIAEIYASASHSFSNDAFEKSTLFWLSVDYFNKAAKAGEDCLTEASQKAAQYKQYFPNKEEGFFKGLTEGQNYTVGGWVNETTKVRF